MKSKLKIKVNLQIFFFGKFNIFYKTVHSNFCVKVIQNEYDRK